MSNIEEVELEEVAVEEERCRMRGVVTEGEGTFWTDVFSWSWDSSFSRLEIAVVSSVVSSARERKKMAEVRVWRACHWRWTASRFGVVEVIGKCENDDRGEDRRGDEICENSSHGNCDRVFKGQYI